MERGRYENGYEYTKIGEGRKKLLVIPGLNDEMIRSNRYPLYLKYHFRSFKDREIVIATRKQDLEEEKTTEEMAEDYREIIKEEGKCDVLGISMGGMIAQHLVRKTDKVEKLILGFTGPKLGKEGQEKIEYWIDLLEKEKFGKFYSQVALDTFTGFRKPLYRVVALGLWKEFKRPLTSDLITCAKACLEHDTSSHISEIENETMIIGGTKDYFFPQPMISEMADKIGAECRYISGGHAAFKQNSSDFYDHVQRFLRKN